MIAPRPLISERVRKISGSFAFIEHRFLRDGFWTGLDRDELLLYLFLILASDRNGLSFYGYDKICALLRTTLDEYVRARDGLIEKDLIAFDGRVFQVLSLPERPARKKEVKAPMRGPGDPVAVGKVIADIFGGRYE
jgi:hypothetical protein